MRTQDVKVNKEYLYNGEIVTVVKRIKRPTNKPNMQSGVLFTGYAGKQKKFLLSNGEIVYSDKLEEIQ